MKKLNKSRDQLLDELRTHTRVGRASAHLWPRPAAPTGLYTACCASLERRCEVGAGRTTAPAVLLLADRRFHEVEYGAELFGVISRSQPCDQAVEHQIQVGMQDSAWYVVAQSTRLFLPA